MPVASCVGTAPFAARPVGTLPSLLAQDTFAEDSKGKDYGTVFGPWLRRTMAHAIQLDDAHPCSVRRSSAVGGRLSILEEQLYQLVADCGIAVRANLSLAQEFYEALRGLERSRFVGRVHVRTWGVASPQRERHMQNE